MGDLVDSGFVAHAQQTAAWVRSHTDQLAVVVNTHWHSDHVGGNALLQAAGARIAPSVLDAAALADLDPGCCQAEYLDQPVPQYTVDEPLTDGQAMLMGDAEWQVIGTPGHTHGHLSFWQPDLGLLILGDAMSDYDVGWVNIAVDGPDTAATALASLHRLSDLHPKVILPAHGPIPADPAITFATGLRRGQAPRRRPGRRHRVRRPPNPCVRADHPRRNPRQRHPHLRADPTVGHRRRPNPGHSR